MGRLVVAKLHGQRIIVGVMRLAFIPIPNSAVHGCPGVWFPEKPDELVSDSGKALSIHNIVQRVFQVLPLPQLPQAVPRAPLVRPLSF